MTISEAAGRAVGVALGALVMAVARPIMWLLGAFPSAGVTSGEED